MAVAEGLIDVGFDRVLIVQVNDSDVRKPLAEAIDSSDPLFDAHRVPRHIVIHQRAAELEVQAFRGGVGTNQDLGYALP